MDPIRFGLTVRALRRHRGWRQGDLAEAAGVSDSTISRVEAGRIAEMSVGTLADIGRALGAVLEVTVRWQGERLDRLLDQAHADLVEQIVRRLRAGGWETAVEVSFAIAGERGSVDVLAFRPDAGLLVVVEVKSVVPDLQATLHGLDRKARLGRWIAAQRGWRAREVGRLLVVADTRTNRRRLETHGATVAAALPMSGRAVAAWILSPTGPLIAGRWFLPRSHPVGGTGGGRQRVRVPRSGTSVASER